MIEHFLRESERECVSAPVLKNAKAVTTAAPNHGSLKMRVARMRRVASWYRRRRLTGLAVGLMYCSNSSPSLRVDLNMRRAMESRQARSAVCLRRTLHNFRLQRRVRARRTCKGAAT